MKGQTLLLALVAGASVHANGLWKTKLVVNRSVHEKHTEMANSILLQKEGSPNTSEWRAFGSLLEESAGTVCNDANSHGNVIINLREREGEGPEELTSALRANPIAFNGGPFYRWWTRMVEAGAQYNLGIPARPGNGLGCWLREGLVPRNARSIYRYMGYMAHLVQDNCSPAHAANIRHGIYEGIEYWHWDSMVLGGAGQDVPQESISLLLAQMNEDGRGFWQSTGLKQFWNAAATEEIPEYLNSDIYNRGGREGESRKLTESFLVKVIADTRTRVMPSAEQLRATKIFEFYNSIPRGRRPHEFDPRDPSGQSYNQYKQLWDFENKSFIGTSAGKANSLFAQPEPDSEPTRSTARLLREIYAFPQFQVNPANLSPVETLFNTNVFRSQNWGTSSSQLWWWAESTPAGPDPFLNPAAQPLNAHRMPYLPNPSYIGRGFDLNWGSYGGYFGYPGRVPVDGENGPSTMLTDAFRADARITPGDLYCMHSTRDYDPHTLVPFSGYYDERVLRDLKANPYYEQHIGLTQVKNSVFWTASLLHSLSMALPPVLTQFRVEPRVPNRGMLDVIFPRPAWDLNAWTTLPKQGAYLSVAFAANRNTEPYRVEFYAIPKAVIQEHGNRPRTQGAFAEGKFLNCTREISLGAGQALFTSDFGIEDLGGDTTTTGTPPSPAPLMPVYYRDYDFVYGQLPLLPLKVVGVPADQLESNSTPAVATSPGAGFPISRSALVPNVDGTIPSNLPWKCLDSIFFRWDGEVSASPVKWDGTPDNRGKAYLVRDPQNPNRWTLKTGEYFILVVLYREGMREAFANNQFKLMNPTKERLEQTRWWKSNWLKALDNQPDEVITNAKEKILIPDELYPVVIDSGAIRLVAR